MNHWLIRDIGIAIGIAIALFTAGCTTTAAAAGLTSAIGMIPSATQGMHVNVNIASTVTTCGCNCGSKVMK